MSTSSERVGDIEILPLNTQGFEQLPAKKQLFLYFMAEAGLHGRDIIFDQMSAYNLSVKVCLESLFSQLEESHHQDPAFNALSHYLKLFWLHAGIYDSHTGTLLACDLSLEQFRYLLKHASELEPKIVDDTEKVLFLSKEIPQDATDKSGKGDCVLRSGVNFYQNLTEREVEQYRNGYPQGGEQPPHGFNAILKKDKSGKVVEERICLHGLYGQAVAKIIENLQRALPYASDQAQGNAVKSLLAHYASGDAKSFDAHCVDWVKDINSGAYFINGCIEDYEDPKKIVCTYQSIVAFEDEKTARIGQLITDNVQWFEDNMPVETRFKKPKAVGVSGTSVNVISMAGRTAPILPLGINLPNSAWISKQVGSRSVNLKNILDGRAKTDIDLIPCFYSEDVAPLIKLHGQSAFEVMVFLHEQIGHGSCQMLPGISLADLGVYGSLIEETRADLAGIHFIGSAKLQEFGIIDPTINHEDFVRAFYTDYLTFGGWSQLYRLPIETNKLVQTHARNRQLIASWIIEKGQANSCLRRIKESGRDILVIDDLDKCGQLFAQLLGEIQRIKSTGDAVAAEVLCEQFGTLIDKTSHQQVLSQVEPFSPASYHAFIAPEMRLQHDQHGNEIGVSIMPTKTFATDQMTLTKRYSHLTPS